ncbi:hypothetical protein Hanom_Chr12g01150521 [Helianthus anomalus]
MDPTHNTLPLSPSPSCRIGVPSPSDKETDAAKGLAAVLPRGKPLCHFPLPHHTVYPNTNKRIHLKHMTFSRNK